MGERKVLNKYYPPDFDPNKIPRRKMPKDRQHTVRLMAPFNMRCTTCGEYIYKGKKFNAKKETCLDEEYLGLAIFRFYIRCNLCASEIAFKTDPKNTDYVCEIGATRNFENWREAPAEDEAAIEARGEAEEQNPMAALEARTKESKQEMDILDALEEIKDLNARKMNVDIDDLIAAKEEAKAQLLAERRAKKEAREAAADDAAVAAAFGGGSSSGNVKRLESSSDEDEAADARSSARGPSSSEKGKGKAAAAAIRKRGVKLGPGADGGEGAAESGPAGKKRKLGGMLGGLKGLIKKKATGAGPTAAAPAKPKAPAAGPAAANNDGDEGGSSSSDDGGGGGGGGLLGSDYGSSSD